MASILTTLHHPSLSTAVEGADDLTVDTLDRRQMSTGCLLRRLVRDAGRHDVVILDGSVGARNAYVDLVAAIVIARRGVPVKLVIADSTWKRGSWWLDRWACRAGMRALDAPGVTFCVLSTEERATFPRTWGVDPGKVRFTPWCYTLTEEELQAPVGDNGSIFAGGDSMRDYGPLLTAAEGVRAEVVIASRQKSPGPTPPNVRMGAVTHAEFLRLMREARVVVVPLAKDAERSAGQQTYLNAMALGKLVVVTDGPGARDYVEDGETGLVVAPGSATALADALLWALDPAHEPAVSRMRERARKEVLSHFRPQDYAQSVIEVALSLVRSSRR